MQRENRLLALIQASNLYEEHTEKVSKSFQSILEKEGQRALPPIERYLIKLEGSPEEDNYQIQVFTYSLILRRLIAHKHWEGNKDYNLGMALKDIAPLLHWPSYSKS